MAPLPSCLPLFARLEISLSYMPKWRRKFGRGSAWRGIIGDIRTVLRCMGAAPGNRIGALCRGKIPRVKLYFGIWLRAGIRGAMRKYLSLTGNTHMKHADVSLLSESAVLGRPAIFAARTELHNHAGQKRGGKARFLLYCPFARFARRFGFRLPPAGSACPAAPGGQPFHLGAPFCGAFSRYTCAGRRR